jgi:type II secretory pathway component PulF
LRGEETAAWAEQARCRPLDLAISLRQLATLVLSGIHITQAIKVVAEQCSSPVLVEVWWTVEQSLHDGYPLSRSLERFPGIFNRLVTTLVRVGESSGSLPLCLEQIANWLERDHRLRSSLRSSLTYPAFVLGFTALLTWWLFSIVLPPFLAVVAQTGVTLPLPTRALALVVHLISSPLGWTLALGVLACAYRFRLWALKPEGRIRCMTVLHSLPMLGPFLCFSANVRAALAASILLRTGCDSITTWKLALQACDDPVVLGHLNGLLSSIRNGDQPSEYFSRHPEHFLPVFGQMVRGGEETGRLPRFLEGLCRLLEEELEHRIGLLLAILEPLVMMFLSGLMLFVLLAVFLPLYSHLSSLGA